MRSTEFSWYIAFWVSVALASLVPTWVLLYLIYRKL